MINPILSLWVPDSYKFFCLPEHYNAHTYIHTCTHTVYTYTHTYTYICTYTHINMYTYIHTYMHILMYHHACSYVPSLLSSFILPHHHVIHGHSLNKWVFHNFSSNIMYFMLATKQQVLHVIHILSIKFLTVMHLKQII